MKRFLLRLSVIIILGSLLIWLQFISLPYLTGKRIDAEMVSSAILWPVRGHAFTPFVNGRVLVFGQEGGRSNLLRVVEADGRIYDIRLPDGGEVLYRTGRSPHNSPVVAIWDGRNSVESQWTPDRGMNFSLVEIRYDGSIDVKEFMSKKITYIMDVNDTSFLAEKLVVDRDADESDAYGVPVIGSLDGIAFSDFPIVNDKNARFRSIRYAFFRGDGIIYSFGRVPTVLFEYLPITNVVTAITTVIDETPYPINWAGNENLLVWSDRRDGSTDDRGRNIGSYDIFCYNGERRGVSVLVNDEGDQKLPFLSGDHLFWVDDRNYNKSGYDIYVKNIRTGLSKVLIEGPEDDLFPVLFNGYLYWTVRIRSIMTDLSDMDGQRYVFRKKVELP